MNIILTLTTDELSLILRAVRHVALVQPDYVVRGEEGKEAYRRLRDHLENQPVNHHA